MTRNKRSRLHYIDNLRWVTVVLVLIYHVFYNFNAVGVFGGIAGGFAEEQWQDVICSALNPWFMTLLFLLAGASSRYALKERTPKEFFGERTRKLLVPSTLGLLVIGAPLGYINITAGNGWASMPADMPFVARYFVAVVSGTGPLWFIQDLYIFSLLLLLLRRVVNTQSVERWIERLSDRALSIVMYALFPLLWALAQTHIDNVGTFDGLLNLYRPIFYFVVFVAGYYIFSSERTHELLSRQCVWLLAVMAISGVGFCTKFYGEDYTSAVAVQSLWSNLYCVSATLAMIGVFRRWYDSTSKFAGYMTRSSYGLYIVHMVVCSSVCLWLKGSALPVWEIYCVAIAITLAGSVAMWEVLSRVPVIRWVLFGIRSDSAKIQNNRNKDDV